MGPEQEKPPRMTPCCLGNRTAGLAFPTAGWREEAGCGVPGAGGEGGREGSQRAVITGQKEEPEKKGRSAIVSTAANTCRVRP